MPSPTFDLFEEICNALRDQESLVLTERDFPSSLINDLKHRYRLAVETTAIEQALHDLEEHFRARGSRLPFDFNVTTAEYRIRDQGFI